MSTTVRVSDRTRQRVAAMAATTGQQMQTIIDEAVEAYERELFWRGFEAGYEQLADDAEAWDEVEAERSAQAPALRDGLVPDGPGRGGLE
jgi:predicted transcriptional regulator